MAKKKKRGRFCWKCRQHRANEKFSGKGHQKHICKDCNREIKQEKRERKRANKKAIDAGLRPLKKRYPKTLHQAASYLQININDFELACEQLQLNPCGFTDDWDNPVGLYDMDVMIAVRNFVISRENINDDG